MTTWVLALQWVRVTVATHLVRVCPQGNAEGAGKTKVGELEVSFLVDEEVLRLQVAVEDTVRVAVVQALDKLVAELLWRCQSP